ncbi:aminotransferase class I/II-fold pyridoxal phosphate-dependent enzyme [Microtetraspora sp. NBRC 16547]|uniref:trans-sulfuration enzyme family protein n=1 Tax=Microtetraspora sp. NBRC 16547 TaxID=3030993 RepID=UPI0024A1DBCA|nr:aminotransferase class I/II-fold pyridoxal phosphate-dependent enzyme [Microtetraspora sp. NBRC 16547]GLX01416.1 cystathionine gamma-synthase [Microtetraspora sp. NBRC 16547]
MISPRLQLDSIAVHAGREDLAELGVHALPIDLSSTNPLPDVEVGGLSYEAMAGGGTPYAEGGAVYGRLWNPTVARFESALARMEHTEAAVAFSSGMAATTAAILATTRETGRRHIVAVRPLYGGTDHLLASGVLGAEATFCTAEGVAAALRPDTALIILETPANPTLDLVDIRAVVEAARGVPVLVDNTFATPILQNPVDFGASMVLHSATKYLGGHGDVIAGVIACDQEQAAALRRVRAITGALLHPLGAYLLHRGLATLPIRVRAQQANAQRIAAWLSTHPSVSRVHYPGIAEDPRGLLNRQMKGTGAMISIDLRGGLEQARHLTSAVRLFTHAVSLGGVDSLIQHPASLTHRPVTPDARPSDGLVRLSIGLEDHEDLMADLDQALAAHRPAPARAGVSHA